jgi:hypothetical protein
MEQYQERLEMAIAVIQVRYNEKLNEVFDFEYDNEAYQLKPMFMDKYSKAYNMGLDDMELGVENPTVNLSVYKNNQLVNMTISFEDFKLFYRAVKNKVRQIEQKYQEYLAEFSQIPTEERLNYLIGNNIF